MKKKSDFQQFKHELRMRLVERAESKSEVEKVWQKEFAGVAFTVTLCRVKDTTYLSEDGERYKLGFVGYFLLDIPSLQYRDARLIRDRLYGSVIGARQWQEFLQQDGRKYFQQTLAMAEKAIKS